MTKAKALQSVFPGLSGKPNPQYINVSKTIMRASIMRKNELKIPLKNMPWLASFFEDGVKKFKLKKTAQFH